MKNYFVHLFLCLTVSFILLGCASNYSRSETKIPIQNLNQLEGEYLTRSETPSGQNLGDLLLNDSNTSHYYDRIRARIQGRDLIVEGFELENGRIPVKSIVNTSGNYGDHGRIGFRSLNGAFHISSSGDLILSMKEKELGVISAAILPIPFPSYESYEGDFVYKKLR